MAQRRPYRPYIRVRPCDARDIRLRRIALDLEIPHTEVLGRLIGLWLEVRDRKSLLIDAFDAHVVCGELLGFVEVLLTYHYVSLFPGTTHTLIVHAPWVKPELYADVTDPRILRRRLATI